MPLQSHEMNSLLNFNLGQLDLTKLSNSEIAALRSVLTPRMTKYIPHTPTPKQAAFMLLDCKEAFYGGASLALDTPILTPKGYITVQDLREGDQVLSVDGTWTEILQLTPIELPTRAFLLTFSNGEQLWTDADHQWTVLERRLSLRRDDGSDGHTPKKVSTQKVVTSQEIYEMGVNLPRKRSGLRYKLPAAIPYVGQEQELPISPYVLGYWLGDGSQDNGQICVGIQDLVDVSAQFVREGNPFTSQSKKSDRDVYQCVASGLHTKLRELGLIRNKRIPEAYFSSSREQRLALLGGLIDSDGSLRPDGSYTIAQSPIWHTELLEDIKRLLLSLGFNYNETHTQSALNQKTFPVVALQFNPREQVCKIPRKQFHQEKRSDTGLFITAIEKLPTNKAFRCIRVAHPSHLFLAGKKLIPTHNCGGGKSDALLMCALQYVDVQGYSAILFRKTYADLTKPGALIDRAKEWLLPHKDVRWDEKEKKFSFLDSNSKYPVSTLQFGYLENENDRYRYQGGEYTFIGFDELTHISKSNYTYLFSRLRRLKGVNIPLRVRSASNPPDDDGGIWVKERFIDEGPSKGRVFIPAGLNDNPYLDRQEYICALEELDPVTRARLREGDWSITRKGNMFKREWIEQVDVLPPHRRTVRWWDMAASDEEKAKRKNKSGEPDYTASLKVSEFRGIYYIEDIIRVRKNPEGTETLQHLTAVADGHNVAIREEQEPGSSGLAVISNKSRTIFKGYNYKGVPSTGSKVDRAQIASAAAGNGNIKIVRGCRNMEEFFNEMESFPGGIHDDMVDCLSGCVAELGSTTTTGAPITVQGEASQSSKWIEDPMDDDPYVGVGYFSRFGT